MGRFLRTAALEELPQPWNVLMEEIGFVLHHLPKEVEGAGLEPLAQAA